MGSWLVGYSVGWWCEGAQREGTEGRKETSVWGIRRWCQLSPAWLAMFLVIESIAFGTPPPIHLHAPFQGDSTCSLQQAPCLDCDPGHSEPRLWCLCQSTEIFLSEFILNTCFTQSISHMTLGRVKKIFYCRRLTCKSLLCLYNAYSVLTEWLYLACVMVDARIRMMLLGYHFHVEEFLSESHFQLI